MAEEKKVSLILDGKAEGIIAAMTQAENAVRTQTSAMTSHFNTVSGAVNKITGIVGTVTAILAGGAMFKSVIGETIKWTGEANKLAKQLGITTEEASILNMALGDAYLSQEDMSAASSALTKNSLKSKEAFEHYGIALKESNGQQRSTVAIMTDVNEKILSVKEGRDREIVGMQLYGKAWDSVRGILKLNKEGMEEARRKAEELHMIVGPEAVARTKAYKAAMNDVEDIFLSLKIQVGDQVLPILTKLAVWFNDVGPTATTMFGGALKGITTFAAAAGLGFMILYDAAGAAVRQVVTTVTTASTVIERVLAGDFKGAVAAGKAGLAEFNQAGIDFVDSITKRSQQTYNFLESLWTNKPIRQRRLPADLPDKPGADPYEKDKGDKAMAAEKARLQLILAGFKTQEEAARQHSAMLIDEDDFYFKTGLIGQEGFNNRKYDNERQALLNTQELLNQEIKAIADSQAKQLALAKPEDKDKVLAESKKETEAKLAERQKLNAELYQLDARYFTETRVLALNRAAEDLNDLAVWGQRRRLADEADLLQTAQFNAERSSFVDNGFANELLQLRNRYNAYYEHWVEMSETEDQFRERKGQLDSLQVAQEENLIRVSAQRKNAWMFDAAQTAIGIMQMFGSKNKAVALASIALQKGLNMATTYMSTQTGSMLAYASQLIPGDPTSIVRAEVARDYTLVQGAVSMGLIAAQGLAEMVSSASGGSAGSYGGGVPGSPVVTQPVNQAQQPGLNITVQVQGNVISDDRWIEERLAPTIKDLALNRNVSFGFATVS